MSEEQAPHQAGKHQHTYRVTSGEAGVVRFCERCGKAWVMQELRDLVTNKMVYQWAEIWESAQEATQERLVSD
jgi:hypothetical protein